MNKSTIYTAVNLSLVISVFSFISAGHSLVIKENWTYTRKEIDHKNNDWDGALYDLKFSNFSLSTTATAKGWVRADEEIDGASWAKGYMNFTFAFHLGVPHHVWLADHFWGKLSLRDEDSDNFAYGKTNAKIYYQRTGIAVASLPGRNKIKTEIGSWNYDERESFYEHYFLLPAGDYFFKAFLDIGAGAYEGGWFDDRMRSDFNYEAKMMWNPVPEPATVLLFGFGLIGLFAIKKRKF